MSKKILLICNSSDTVVNFRSDLIKRLIDNEYTVDVLCSDDERNERIKALGVNSIYVIPYSSRGTNPFSFLNLKKSFSSAIKRIKPDIVFTFAAKANIVGASAAHKCKIKHIASMVEGLGDPFQPTSFRKHIVRIIVSWLYKQSMKHSGLVIFLNKDDKNEFIKRRIVNDSKSIVIPSIGIDTKSIVMSKKDDSNKRVIMLSRLIASKGIMDFCKTASLVREKRKDITFELYGKEQDIKIKDLQPYINRGDIKYCGFTNNPIETIASATIYVSTSFYREGFPRTFLEAMAVGTPIIATNTIGSRDAIINNETGYLVDIHDIETIAHIILEIIDNKEELIRISNSARKYCEEHFNSDSINDNILKSIESLSKND